MPHSSIVDIYMGEYINVWSDEDNAFIDVLPNGVTLNLPTESLDDFLDDLGKAKEALVKIKSSEIVSSVPVEKRSWEDEIDDILKSKGDEELFNKRVTNFIKILSEDRVEITSEWRKVITQLFMQDMTDKPILICCVRAFLIGAVWEKYKEELDR